MEIELPLDKESMRYLVYRVNVRPGRFFSNAIQFQGGEMTLVTVSLGAKEVKKEIGSFTVKPVVPKPMVDRTLQC